MCALHHAPVDTRREIRQNGERIGEDGGLAAQGLELWTRETDTARAAGSGAFHGEQLTGVPHGIDAEDEVVEDGERRGDEPQAEGHGADDGERDRGRAGKAADRIARRPAGTCR